MKLTRMETRFAGAVLEAFAPRIPRRPAGAIDYLGTLDRILHASTRKAAFGMRAALWIVAFAPVWRTGRLGTIVGLSLERRARILRRLLVHRSFIVRELVLLLKVNAAFALLGDPAVRALSGFDGRATRRLTVVGQSA